MKAAIHPDSYTSIEVKCACGATYATKSIRDSFAVDICSACHPFFTGKARIMDREGRVEKFKNRYKF